jgi:hypothetical protein
MWFIQKWNKLKHLTADNQQGSQYLLYDPSTTTRRTP